LCADGRLESESCELTHPHNKDSTGKYVVSTKHYRATPKQLTEITRLAQEPDFVPAQSGYSGDSVADAVIVPHDTNELSASLNKIFREIEASKRQ
jgi:hypothetical protein